MEISYRSGIVLFVLFFFAYFPVIYELRDSVIGNELARHAPLVIALSAFLVYRKRQILARILNNTGSLPDSRRSFPFLFAAALLLNLLGQAAGVSYLSQLSIPLALYGMAIFLMGRKFSRELVFPLLFLLLAFPVPGKIYMELIFPLKLLVTKASGFVLSLVGYPVKIYGNIIEIYSVSIGVVDACSGLNSLMAILTLSVFYSFLTIERRSYRAVIVVSMLPLILIANIIRVTATAILSVKWGPELAEGQLHFIWGVVVFMLAVLGLLVLTKLFMKMEKRRASHV